MDGVRWKRNGTTLGGDQSDLTRSEVARIRDRTADARDREAATRDALADARDVQAAALDAEMDALEHARPVNGGARLGLEVLLRAAEDRKRAEMIRSM